MFNTRQQERDREINARPIKKVLEATGRKKRKVSILLTARAYDGILLVQ